MEQPHPLVVLLISQDKPPGLTLLMAYAVTYLIVSSAFSHPSETLFNIPSPPQHISPFPSRRLAPGGLHPSPCLRHRGFWPRQRPGRQDGTPRVVINLHLAGKLDGGEFSCFVSLLSLCCTA